MTSSTDLIMGVCNKMSKIWRCPECETINQDKKCVICGYENPNFGQLAAKTQKSSLNPEQIPKPKIVQDSLKAQEQHEKSNSQVKKINKAGKIIAAVSITAAAFAMVFFVNDILKKNDKSENSIPTVTLASHGDVEFTATTASISAETEEESETADETTQITMGMLTVPNLSGMSEEEAVAACEAAGISYEIITEESENIEKGYVISQRIPANVEIEEKIKFIFVVSEGEKEVTTVEATETTAVQSAVPVHQISSAVPTETTTTAASSTTATKPWNETEISETLYIKAPCYSRTEALVGSDSVNKYAVGQKINIIAATDTGYFKLDDGTFIHSDYVMDQTEFITIKGKLYSTSLTELNLAGMSLSDDDIKPLSKMVNLTYLKLGLNNISDISALSGLNNLKQLDLRDNNISDISALCGLTNLTDLVLIENNINDISALSELTNLTNLYLDGNNISDISPLSVLINITKLYLTENNISDISPLSRLTNLTNLFLWGNNISDISALNGLINLTYLSLDYDNISDSDIDALQQTLPNCFITSPVPYPVIIKK